MSGVSKFVKAAGLIKKNAEAENKPRTPCEAPAKECNPLAIEPGLETPAKNAEEIRNESEEVKEIKKAAAAITEAVDLEMARRYQRIRNERV